MWADSEGRCHPFEKPTQGLTIQTDHPEPKTPWEPPVDIHKVHTNINGALDWLDRYVPHTSELVVYRKWLNEILINISFSSKRSGWWFCPSCLPVLVSAAFHSAWGESVS